MKQFFSKKWVFLSSIIASAVFVIGLLIMVCVPQFYIGSYKATAVEDGVSVVETISFKSSKKLISTIEYSDETEVQEMELWYFTHNGDIIVVGDESMTEAQYELKVKLWKNSSEEERKLIPTVKMSCNLFSLTSSNNNMRATNAAGVAFFVIDLALALVSLAGAGYATWLYLQNKKATPTAEEAEAPAEEAAE